jgi:SAM-dependent methyltransferase
MPDQATGLPDAVTEFVRKLETSVAEGTFVRLVLSGNRGEEADPKRVVGRCVELKNQPHLSLTFHYARRDEVQNIPIQGTGPWLSERLGKQFGNALLCTVRGDWQLAMQTGKRPRLIRHGSSQATVPSREHDRRRPSLLDSSAHDWLAALGVTDANGRVRSGMADKYTQINRYLEILSHLAAETGWLDAQPGMEDGAAWTIADMGCGKGYLTFGLWHLSRRVWHLPVRVLGIDARPELVVHNNQVAASLGATDLTFQRGEIESVELPALRALMALHACNTATDDAIRRGITLGAQLIVVAPCCHQEVRPQLGDPLPLAPVLRHGLMRERMAEWATDGLRALVLEWAGYRTKVFEFVASEHTPKNLMISAVRVSQPGDRIAAEARIQEFKKFFGIEHHALDSLLTGAESAG